MTEQELMLTSLLGCPRVDLYTKKRQLTTLEQVRLEQMNKLRQMGEPLQYILGTCDFMGLVLKVDHRVMIPRPETEILVQTAVDRLSSFIDLSSVLGGEKTSQVSRPLKILDLGTGSGNIAIALAKLLTRVQIVSVDISEDALDMALDNARTHHVMAKINFVQQDMSDYLKKQMGLSEKFDMIISNPPYVPAGQITKLSAEVQREPRLALDGGEDGLRFYRDIFNLGHQLLAKDGFIAVEIGDQQSAEILTMLSHQAWFQDIKMIKDYAGIDRIILAA